MATELGLVSTDAAVGAAPQRRPSISRCLVLIGAVKLSLAIAGLDRTLQWLRRHVEPIDERGAPGLEQVRRVEQRVAMAAAFYPGHALCLEQSLVLYYLLRRRGIPARFRLGVQARPFAAHAWIEYRGEPVNDIAEHVKRFAPIESPLQ